MEFAIHREYMTLRRCFWGIWLCIIATSVVMALLGDVWPNVVILLVAKFAMLACFVWYLNSLRNLASAISKRPWVWGVLTFITTLIGMVVSFFWMRHILKRQQLI